MNEERDSLWKPDSGNDPQQLRLEALLRGFSAEARGLSSWKPAHIDEISAPANHYFTRTKATIVSALTATILLGASYAYRLYFDDGNAACAICENSAGSPASDETLRASPEPIRAHESITAQKDPSRASSFNTSRTMPLKVEATANMDAWSLQNSRTTQPLLTIICIAKASNTSTPRHAASVRNDKDALDA